MELGIMGAIVGVALGTLGTVIGTIASLRSASSNAERRSILGWAFVFFALIVAFAAGIDMASMDIKVDPESQLETLENVPRGALVLILIDATTSKAVWAGIATGEIQRDE